MQLSTDSIQKLQQLITIAQTAEIDRIIIEDGKVRGISEDKSVVLFSETNVPDFGFPSIAFNRLGTLASRLALVKTADTVVIDSKKGKNDLEVGMLDISWAGAKVQYRCADPVTAGQGAPKVLRDPNLWSVNVDTKQIPMIVNALRSMKADRVNLNTRTGSEVFLELVEPGSNDVFTITIASGAEFLQDDLDEAPKSKVWVRSYPAAQLISVMRMAAEGKDSIEMVIGENGTLQVVVHDTYRVIVVSLAD